MPLSKDELSAILSNSRHPKNLLTEALGGEEIKSFITGLFEAINNRDTDQLPNAHLNSNGSVSLFFHKCNSDTCATCEKADTFEAALELCAPQIEHHRERMGLPLAEGETTVLSTIDHVKDTELMEYRFNLSPLDLDNILKYNTTYGGYRNTKSGGLLKLVTHHTAQFSKETICLFPVKILDDTYCTPLIAGCQTTEIPSVQLRQFIPGYDGVDKPFHYVPSEVARHFGLHKILISTALNLLLEQSNMNIDGEQITLINDETLFNRPSSKKAPIQFIPMSGVAREIYLRYGNVGALELEHCLSAEVRTIDFMKAVRANMDEDNTSEEIAHVEEIIKRLVKKEASMQSSSGASASMTVEEGSEPPRPNSP